MASDRGILVVEDERIVAEDLRRTLESLGYAVLGIASSGAEAIWKVAETRPDLVLMDIRLQGHMDGTEAASRIRQRFDIPVVYLTAYGDESTLERARVAEPYGYIIKPFQETELHSSIEIALYKHKMERQLKENERWLWATLRCIGEAVIAADAKECVKFMNPVAEVLTGRSQLVLGQHFQEVFNIVDEDTQESVKDPVGRLSQEGTGASKSSGTLLIRADGSRIPIEGNAGYIRDEKGDLTGVVAVFRDVTERRRTEAALARADKLRALAQTAGGIAHEFNNVLVRIQGCADLALMGLGEDPDAVREDMEGVISGATDAARVVRRLELLHRRADDLSDFVPLQLDALVSEALAWIRSHWQHDPFAERDNLRVRTNLTPPPPVWGNPDELRRVLARFIGNAIQAMPTGGTLAVETGHDSTWSFVTVSDTDRGIRSETKRDAFEPFFTTRSDTGDELGMATATSIIERHGGEISAESQPGIGTSFTLRLPTAEGFGGDGRD